MKRVLTIILIFTLLLSGCSLGDIDSSIKDNEKNSNSPNTEQEDNSNVTESGNDKTETEQSDNDNEDSLSQNEENIEDYNNNQGNEEDDEIWEEIKKGTPGNTPGNIYHWGIAATDGEWEYFWPDSQNSSNEGLCKMRLDGTYFEVLSDEDLLYINVVGDWIYYVIVNSSSISKIYKVRKDGTDKQEICEEGSSDMTVVGDWIYFINLSKGGRIYRVKTDGSELTPLSELKVYDLQYENGWLYYLVKTGDDEFVLYKRKGIIGAEPIMIMDGFIMNEDYGGRYDEYIVNKGWIYYTNDNHLYRIKDNGTNKTKLLEQPVRNFNIANDTIYWFSKDRTKNKAGFEIGREAFKMNLDGSGIAKIPYDDSGVEISSVVGEYIYYWKDNAEYYVIARMKNDGTKDRIMIYEKERAMRN